MAQLIKIKRGNRAQLPTLAAGEPGVCLDTGEVFIGTAGGNVFMGRALSGTEAARPAAGTLGRLYYITSGASAGYLYFDNGSAWERVNAQTIDDIADGTNYAKVKKADVTGGSVNKVSDGTNTKTAAEIKTHIDDATKHRVINDNNIQATELWSSQKISNEIELAKKGVEYQDSVKDKDLTTPPTSPQYKDRYIVKATATGAWVGKETKIAERDELDRWVFHTPIIGTTVYVDDEQKQYSWNGTAWVISGGAPQTINAGAGLTGGGQADTVTLTVGAGNGITVGATSVGVKGYKGITVDSNGVAANIDGLSIVYGASDKLTVGTVDGGTF